MNGRTRANSTRGARRHVPRALWLLLTGTMSCGAATQAPQASSAGEGSSDAMDAGSARAFDAGGGESVASDGTTPSSVADQPTLDASDSDSDAGKGIPQPVGSEPEFAATPVALAAERSNYRVVRLTHSQWENSVRQLLRLDAATGLSEGFTPDPWISTFTNDEMYLEVGSTLQGDYAAAAESLAAATTANAEQLTLVQPETDVGAFVRAFGRRAFRRPLTGDEEERYIALHARGVQLSTEQDFLRGAELVIASMLQAPQFLYRSELGEDGAPLTGFEVASKLSFALRDSAPDDDWLDRAQQGEFDTEEGLLGAAREVLELPPAVQQMRSYQGQVLRLARLRLIEKTGDAGYDPAVNASLETASWLFFDDLFNRSLGVKDIFTSTRGYVDAQLAPLYGIADVEDGWQQVDFDVSRTGYFAQLPFLILHSVNLTPDSIHRGAELQDRVLCGKLTAPFTGVDLAPHEPGETNRQYVSDLTERGECAACHAHYVNPLGFAFENFDGLGQLRTTDNGQPVNTQGTYPFSEGSKQFADSTELMQILASSTQVHQCYVRHLGEFLLARRLSSDETDKATLERLAESSQEGASIKQLILDWVSSPLFRTRMGGTG